MNYLKTFKPSTDTFGKPPSWEWAIRITLQLICDSERSKIIV